MPLVGQRHAQQSVMIDLFNHKVNAYSLETLLKMNKHKEYKGFAQLCGLISMLCQEMVTQQVLLSQGPHLNLCWQHWVIRSTQFTCREAIDSMANHFKKHLMQ